MSLLDRFLTTADWPGSIPPRRGRTTAGAGTWGDGLAELSLPGLMASCTWEDTGRDELAFLFPALVDRRADAARERLSGLLHGAYVAHVFMAMHAGARREGIGLALALERLWQRGLATGLRVAEVCADGPQAVADLGLADVTNVHRAHDGVPYLMVSADIALIGLERALHRLTMAAAPPADAEATARSGEAEPDLDEALELSIHSGLNAAYVYPRFAFAHELLLAGAWLGHLARGRPAYMPPAVASCLIDCLECFPRRRPGQGVAATRHAATRPGMPGRAARGPAYGGHEHMRDSHRGEGAPGGPPDRLPGDPAGACVEILAMHADLAIGTRRLAAIATRVRATGHPKLVLPCPASVRARWFPRTGKRPAQ